MPDEKVFTHEELVAQLAEAAKKQDWSAVRKVSAQLDALEKNQAKAIAEAKVKELAGMTEKVKAKFDAVAEKLVQTGELDKADGIWYARDFGEKLTTCRLMKSAPKSAKVAGSSTGSYVSVDVKTSTMLEEVGSEVMFDKETTVTIDKVEQVIPVGFTYAQAQDLSNNGGWRNRVRMALLKKTGRI